MPTSMEKPLNGAGLAVVNQIFNERLSQLEGGAGGVNWEATPYTNMNFNNNNDVFCCTVLSTERPNSMLRFVRCLVIAHVKSSSYSGSQKIELALPEGFPTLNFPTASNNIPQMTGTGTVKAEMSGAGSKITFFLNQAKTAISGGLYVGCVTATVIG